jgi:hypothetical protein
VCSLVAVADFVVALSRDRLITVWQRKTKDAVSLKSNQGISQNCSEGFLLVVDNMLWCVGNDGVIRTWETKSWKSKDTLKLDQPISAGAVRSQSVWLGTDKGDIVVMKLSGSKERTISGAHSSKITLMAIHGAEVITCGVDKALKIWSPVING